MKCWLYHSLRVYVLEKKTPYAPYVDDDSDYRNTKSFFEEIVNLKRRPSKKLEKGEVYIGRQMYMGGWKLKASKWANPYKIKEGDEREAVLEKYEEYIRSDAELMKDLKELKGKKLACWCHPEKCHGDMLLKLLNE